MSTPKKPTKKKKPRKSEGQIYKGKQCCVKNCQARSGRKESIRLFRARRARNSEQNRLWAQALNFANLDGSLKYPTKNDRVCSKHFVSGAPSSEVSNPDFVPSIFPTQHVKSKSNVDYQRWQRKVARALKKSPKKTKYLNPKQQGLRPYHEHSLLALSSDDNCRTMLGMVYPIYYALQFIMNFNSLWTSIHYKMDEDFIHSLNG